MWSLGVDQVNLPMLPNAFSSRPNLFLATGVHPNNPVSIPQFLDKLPSYTRVHEDDLSQQVRLTELWSWRLRAQKLLDLKDDPDWDNIDRSVKRLVEGLNERIGIAANRAKHLGLVSDTLDDDLAVEATDGILQSFGKTSQEARWKYQDVIEGRIRATRWITGRVEEYGDEREESMKVGTLDDEAGGIWAVEVESSP